MPDRGCLIADGGTDSGRPDTPADMDDGGGADTFDLRCEMVPIVVDELISVFGTVTSDLVVPAVDVPRGRGVTCLGEDASAVFGTSSLVMVRGVRGDSADPEVSDEFEGRGGRGCDSRLSSRGVDGTCCDFPLDDFRRSLSTSKWCCCCDCNGWSSYRSLSLSSCNDASRPEPFDPVRMWPVEFPRGRVATFRCS